MMGSRDILKTTSGGKTTSSSGQRVVLFQNPLMRDAVRGQ